MEAAAPPEPARVSCHGVKRTRSAGRGSGGHSPSRTVRPRQRRAERVGLGGPGAQRAGDRGDARGGAAPAGRGRRRGCRMRWSALSASPTPLPRLVRVRVRVHGSGHGSPVLPRPLPRFGGPPHGGVGWFVGGCGYQITMRVPAGAATSGSVTSSPSTRTRPAARCCSIRSSDSPAAVSRSRTVAAVVGSSSLTRSS